MVFYKKLLEHNSRFRLVQINNPDYIPNALEQCKMTGEFQFLIALSLQLTEILLNQVSNDRNRWCTSV